MNSKKAVVTVIIVTYESRDTIRQALNNLIEAAESGIADVVVVDNASRDGTADLISADYQWVKLIRGDRNLGYGRGCNLGFKKAQTPYVLILNPDAEISVPAIQTLVDFMNTNKQVGITAPAIVEGEKGIQAAGLMTTPLSLLKGACGFNQAMPHSQPVTPGGSPFRTEWVCGAIMLVRADLFEKLGGFDPRFFLYFEETDLCRRITKHGMEIWAIGEAVAKHVGGASAKMTGKSLSASCIAEHYYPSRFYYLVKHFGWFIAIGTETMVYALQKIRHWRNRISGCLQSEHFSRTIFSLFRFPSEPGEDT